MSVAWPADRAVLALLERATRNLAAAGGLVAATARHQPGAAHRDQIAACRREQDAVHAEMRSAIAGSLAMTLPRDAALTASNRVGIATHAVCRAHDVLSLGPAADAALIAMSGTLRDACRATGTEDGWWVIQTLSREARSLRRPDSHETADALAALRRRSAAAALATAMRACRAATASIHALRHHQRT